MAEKFYYGTGRRKSAVGRVWMTTGTGQFTINGKPLEEYLVRESDRMLVAEPLRLTNTRDSFDIKVNVRGGGISGQAGAIRHGISRALLGADPEYRHTLKKAGLITRDARVKERKKYGRVGARASFQYSKR